VTFYTPKPISGGSTHPSQGCSDRSVPSTPRIILFFIIAILVVICIGIPLAKTVALPPGKFQSDMESLKTMVSDTTLTVETEYEKMGTEFFSTEGWPLMILCGIPILFCVGWLIWEFVSTICSFIHNTFMD
jgi:hypothetical protein